LGLAASCGPLMEGDHIFIFLPGLVGAGLIAQMRLCQGAPDANYWLAITAAWGVALVTLFVPPHVRLLEPYNWKNISGIAILASGRLGITLYFAALLSAFALWYERKEPVGQHVALTR
jgi:hypothetical protein